MNNHDYINQYQKTNIISVTKAKDRYIGASYYADANEK